MKALFVLALSGFRDEELLVPKEKLLKAGVEITIGGLDMNESVGMLGAKAKADILLKDINIDDYDVLVLPGGRGGREYLIDNALVLALVKTAYEKGKIVAAICSSCMIPAKAGILKGKTATCFTRQEDMEFLKKAGAHYSGTGVLVDGNIITATGPGDSEKFADNILEALKKR
jgi:protease I